MRIKILCPDGQHYVGVNQDGSVDAEPTVADVWEIFELEEFADGRVALKTLDSHPQPNQYVRAVGGGGAELIADRCQANDHEKFTQQTLPGDRVALMTSSQNFWRAIDAGGGELDCAATVPDAWEAFTIQVV